MAWPKAGTVSVTNGNAVITGAGTSFFGSAQAGWGFVGPDGRVYEVLTVDSATQITLAASYQGATAAGQLYALFPTMALAHELAASVQSLIGVYQGIADGPGQGKFSTDVVKLGDEDTGLGWPSSNEAGLKAGGDWQLRLKDGQASGAAVQSGPADATAGKLLLAGAGGLLSADLATCADANDLLGSGAQLVKTFGASNTPPGASDVYAIHHIDRSNGAAVQLAYNLTDNSIYNRSYTSGAWSPWAAIITSVGSQTIGGNLAVTGTVLTDNGFEVRAPDGTGFAKLSFAASSGSLKLDASGGAGTAAFMDLDATASTTEAVNYRLGRGTNTSGEASFRMYAHDGTSLITASIDKAGDAYFAGNVGVRTPAPEGAFHVASGDTGIVVGLQNANGNKFGRIAFTHYAGPSEEPVNALNYFGDATRNILYLGGGTSLNNAATEIRFFTAATSTETGGNEAMRIIDGKVGFGATSPISKLHARETTDDPTAVIDGTNASLTKAITTINATRVASGAYRFLDCYSGDYGDLEMRFSGDGNGSIDGSLTGGGADYAEFFEWALAWLGWARDWKAKKGTLAGISVVLEGDKIRPAQEGEEPIGVISANPSVVGDGDMDRWKGKYLRDQFGAYVSEDFEALSWTETVTETETVQEQATEAQERTREVITVVDGQAVRKIVTETVQVPLFDEFPLFDEQGQPVMEQVQVETAEDGAPVYEERQVIHRAPRMVEVQRETLKEEQRSYPADAVPEGVTVPDDAVRVTQQRRKLNPAYVPGQAYIPRAERPEWDTVGLVGKLRLLKGQPVGDRWVKMRDVSAEVEEWLVR